MRIPDHERMAATDKENVFTPAPPPLGGWATWIARWEPAYLWHSSAVQVAVETRRRSGAKCQVKSEERHDERGRYWVWRVTLL